MSRILHLCIWIFVLGALPARGESVVPGPCDGAEFQAFDFWLGEWQVFDKESGELVAYDRIEKDLSDCVVRERWTSLDDTFRNDNAPFRMRGMSLSAYDGQGWVQIWVDNMGGTIVMQGGLEDGAMVLNTQSASYGTHYQYHYAPMEDGSVHGWGMSRSEGQSEWKKDWDLVYRRNG